MTKKDKALKPIEKQIAHSEHEVKIAQELLAKRAEVNEKGKLPAFKFDVEERNFGPCHEGSKCTEKSTQQAEHNLGLMRVFGTKRLQGAALMLHSLIKSEKDGDDLAKNINSTMAVIEQMEPRDPIESMLAAQMVATHESAMELLGLMRNSETFSRQEEYGRHAQRLLRIYTQQAATFAKYRNGGKQTVEVKHVNVEKGGQAIIGDVHAG